MTERRSRADIDRLASVAAGAREEVSPDGRLDPRAEEQTLTIYERSVEGRRAFMRRPSSTCPTSTVSEVLPDWARRTEPADLPEVSEPEIVRHYNGLSKKNFDLDTGFYPLGSCTMKHNPKLHERVAALPGHARLHPLQDPEQAQGALELMYNLQGALARDRRAAARVAAALGRLARRAGRPAAHPRLPRGPRRAADARC